MVEDTILLSFKNPVFYTHTPYNAPGIERCGGRPPEERRQWTIMALSPPSYSDVLDPRLHDIF